MGLFGSLFGKGTQDKTGAAAKIAWIPLEQQDQLETIQQNSHQKPQLIFKHSTTCGISRMVLGMFKDSLSNAEAFDAYFLDLHAHRPVSNAVAQEFNVMHQSPQLLVIKNGEVVYHTSHGAITEVDLQQFV